MQITPERAATVTYPLGHINEYQSLPSTPRLCPIWTLIVRSGGRTVRRVTVLAPSPQTALAKGRELLDDDETLLFQFAEPTAEYAGHLQTSAVYRPR